MDVTRFRNRFARELAHPDGEGLQGDLPVLRGDGQEDVPLVPAEPLQQRGLPDPAPTVNRAGADASGIQVLQLGELFRSAYEAVHDDVMDSMDLFFIRK